MLKRYLKTLVTTVTYVIAAVFLFVVTLLRKVLGLKDQVTVEARRHRLVVISGCDSGLGLSMAKWAADAGYKVLAGCLQEKGEGAELLRQTPNVFVEQVDVTDKKSISKFAQQSRAILEEHNLDLYALIPNAAVSCLGEFFWLTESQAKIQMDVNFWGAVNLVDAFQKQLLENRSRVILVGSDCADYPLPGFAMYSAAKAALQAWSVSIRLELAKYGVTVVNFQPGSFPGQSRLLTGQDKNFELMRAKMGETGMSDYYGGALEHFRNHMKMWDKNPAPSTVILNDCLKNHLFTLLEKDMSRTAVHVYETSTQAILHFFINIFPRRISDALLLKILNSPSWKPITQD